MSKVFLSHSSADKPLVQTIFNILGERLVEYDAATFEGGLPNWDVIISALDRCAIFVLFATSHALASAWVGREIQDALRRMKDRRLKRMLVFVTDGMALAALPVELRDFAVFLTLTKPGPIAQQIERHLLELRSIEYDSDDDFVGRDSELAELKASLLDVERKVNGISVSGLPLLGRARLIRRAMRDLYPALTPPQRVVDFYVFQSCADLALDLYGSVSPLISPDEIAALTQRFQSDDANACGIKLYELIHELGDQRQFVIFSDRGGVINQSGSLTNIAGSLAKAASVNGSIRVFYITTRRPVARARADFNNIVFFDLEPMKKDAARQYIVQRS